MADSDDDDEVAFLYREGVMGKEVWIKFRVASSSTGFEYYKGIITKMEASFPDQDISKPMEYLHYIYFGDNDDGYYDLSDMEMTGYLKWTAEAAKNDNNNNNNNNDNNKKRAASINTTSSSTTARHVPITPEKRRPQQRSHNNNNNNNNNNSNRNNSASNNVKVKREPGIVGSVRSNIEDPTNDEINMNEFEHWVKNIHRGSKDQPISQANARSVLNRVRDLVSGRGITYKNWPPGKLFHPEVVTLQTDFTVLLTNAKAFEKQYGRDKGNGWLLQHPIKKLSKFKEYIEVKRHERADPPLIS